jgi:hypothetical protein
MAFHYHAVHSHGLAHYKIYLQNCFYYKDMIDLSSLRIYRTLNLHQTWWPMIDVFFFFNILVKQNWTSKTLIFCTDTLNHNHKRRIVKSHKKKLRK